MQLLGSEGHPCDDVGGTLKREGEAWTATARTSKGTGSPSRHQKQYCEMTEWQLRISMATRSAVQSRPLWPCAIHAPSRCLLGGWAIWVQPALTSGPPSASQETCINARAHAGELRSSSLRANAIRAVGVHRLGRPRRSRGQAPAGRATIPDICKLLECCPRALDR